METNCLPALLRAGNQSKLVSVAELEAKKRRKFWRNDFFTSMIIQWCFFFAGRMWVWCIQVFRIFLCCMYILDLCWIVSLQGLPAPGSVCKGWEVQKLPRIHGHLNQGYLDTLHVAWHWNYIFKELGEEILQLWYHFQMDFLDVFGWMNHEYVQSWEKVVPGCAWWCMGHRDE